MGKEFTMGIDRQSNLGDGVINSNLKIDFITGEIKTLTEQIGTLDNKGGVHSDLLRSTQKALEKLKKEIESLEMRLTNKISEGTDFSSCCG